MSQPFRRATLVKEVVKAACTLVRQRHRFTIIHAPDLEAYPNSAAMSAYSNPPQPQLHSNTSPISTQSTISRHSENLQYTLLVHSSISDKTALRGAEKELVSRG